MSNKSDFHKTLANLGETPESIMQVLREGKIKGLRLSCFHCPIAEYLRQYGFVHVQVGVRYPVKLYQSKQDGLLVNLLETVELSPGVLQWIRDFDSGKYPEFEK